MTELKLFNDLTNKDKVSRMVKNIRNEILEGEINPLEAAVVLKGMEVFTKALRTDPLVQDCTIEELERYNSKSVAFNGAKFTIKDVGVSFDFTGCNDPIWDFLNVQMEELKGKMKDREDLLKSLKKPETMVNDETGEIYTVNPPVRKSKTGYSVTL